MSQPLLLALRPLGLGDLLTGLPALRGLRAGFPEHRIALAVPAPLAPLALLCDAVDEVVDAAPLRPLPPLRGNVDVAVNLHGRGPGSHRVLLGTRPRWLLAFAHPDVPESATGPSWQQDEHEVERWCRLLRHYGVAADPRDLELPRPPARPPDVAVGATVLHPGAASAARRWPADRWAAVAAALTGAGERVVLTGAAAEREVALGIAAAAGLPGAHVLAGRTDVLYLAATIAAASSVLCGDTGVGHLATAYGVPSVLLFGPTPPAWWGPPPARGRHRVLWAGQRGDPHADAPHPGLLEITVQHVLAAATEPVTHRTSEPLDPVGTGQNPGNRGFSKDSRGQAGFEEAGGHGHGAQQAAVVADDLRCGGARRL